MRHLFSRYLSYLSCGLILLIGLSSCEVFKKGSSQKLKKRSVEDLLAKKSEAIYSDQYFGAKIKTKYWENGVKGESVYVNLRMKKDSLIWMSISPAIGVSVEVARAMVTKDSIYLLDKINKKYYVRSFDFLQETVKYPIDFQLAQHLILGDTPSACNLNTSNHRGEKYQLKGENCSLELDPNSYYPVRFQLEDAANNSMLEAVLADVKPIADFYFGESRKLKLSDERLGSFEAEMEFSKLKYGEKLSFPFKVSSKYEKVD